MVRWWKGAQRGPRQIGQSANEWGWGRQRFNLLRTGAGHPGAASPPFGASRALTPGVDCSRFCLFFIDQCVFKGAGLWRKLEISLTGTSSSPRGMQYRPFIRQPCRLDRYIGMPASPTCRGKLEMQHLNYFIETMSSTKRTVLITGCSDGGLGSALAPAFHSAGWRVFASARNTNKLKAVEAAGIERFQIDTISDESITTCISHLAPDPSSTTPVQGTPCL